MTPTLPYLLALMAYFVVAGVVWTLALLLALDQDSRPLGKRLAAGMAGSFPGVFLSQLLCLLVLSLFSLLLRGIALIGRPPGVVCLVFALLFIGSFAAASLLGFYLGWRVAWEWAAGRSPLAFVASDWLLGPVVRRVFRGVS